jgi:hypothetical protein
MYWKMSIDLSRPQVPSMGQHDPLDAFITYNELEATLTRVSIASPRSGLNAEIADMVPICRGMNLATDDPLGTGGLLADATRIANLMITKKNRYANLLENVMNASLQGIVVFSESDTLRQPAGYRLAFRELGLSIGLRGAVLLEELIRHNPGVFDHKSNLPAMAKDITGYLPLAEKIEQFWIDERNRMSGTWREHLEINRVMLATSLAPAEFLAI